MLIAIIVALIVALPGGATHAASPFVGTPKPPAGFEALLEPQRSLVDVYYGGRFLLSTMATFDPDSITFQSPEAVVAELPPLRDGALLLNQLRGALATNADHLCVRRGESKCGTIVPDIVGVIFDADRFRADVFIGPRFLVPEAPHIPKHLPKSDGSFSFLQNFSAAYAGSSEDADAYTLASVSTLALRENRIAGVFSYTDADQVAVDTLAFRRDRDGRELVAGLFRTLGSAQSFVGERDVYGVRYASSVNTRTDLAISRGIPLEVFLTQRARVDVLKDGRLINSEFLEAGNRILDTRRLPDGAYDVTLRIRDANGVREDVRFFVKSTRLPPLTGRFFEFEAGRILDRRNRDAFPGDTGHWIVRGGVTQRLSERLGIETALAASGGEALVEVSTFVQGRSYELQGGAFGSSNGNRGGALTTRILFGSLALTADVRQSVRRGDGFSIAPEDFAQQSLVLQHPLFDGTLNFSARRSRRDNDNSSGQGVAYRRPLVRSGRRLLDLSVHVTHEDGQWLALIGAELQWGQGSWTSNVAPYFRYDEHGGAQGAGHQLSGRVSWYDPDSTHGDLRLALRGDSNPIQDSVGSELNYDNRFGQTRIEVNHTNLDGRSLSSYVGTFNSSVLATPDTVAFGGQYQARSAVVIDLDGQAPGTTFDVLVDGTRRGYAPPESRTAIHLRPFETYEIGIRPRGGALVDYDAGVQRVTLYPGNIVTLHWAIAEQIVIVGRILDAAGAPLANARIEGTRMHTVTDEFGMFQLELPKPEGDVMLNLEAASESCRLRFPLGDVRQGVALVGTLTCPSQIGEISSVNVPP